MEDRSALAPPATPARRRDDQHEQPHSNRVSILAVDDHPNYLKYLRTVLTRAGFDVEVANDGASAVERIRGGNMTDLIIIDLKMPGLDGIETLQRIHSEQPVGSVYSILLTSSDGIDVKLRALESGFDDFLSKTAPESEILAKIRSAARRVQMERRLLDRNEELQALVFTDELTGTANRRALFQTAEQLLRSNRPFTAVLFDLDNFKLINDTYGHSNGDRILADVGAAFRAHTRFADVIGRYGGDEFLLLLPDTEQAEARQIADRLLAKIRQLTWTMNDTVVQISAQYGIASTTGLAASLADLISTCDQGLYKRKGRRRERTVEKPLAN